MIAAYFILSFVISVKKKTKIRPSSYLSSFLGGTIKGQNPPSTDTSGVCLSASLNNAMLDSTSLKVTSPTDYPGIIVISSTSPKSLQASRTSF